MQSFFNWGCIMVNALNDLNLTSVHGWVKYDKSWNDTSKNLIRYNLKCSIKPIYKHIGNTFEIVNLDDRYLISRLRLNATQKGKLESVDLFKQLHPHKNPRNNLFCLGKLKGVPICHTLITLLMACLLKYNDNDCFDPPTNVRKIGEGN